MSTRLKAQLGVMMSVVHVERAGELMVATIDRPGSLNAVNFEVMGALESLVEEVEEGSEVKVFALTGAGARSFISGGDLRAFAALGTEDEATEMALRMGEILRRVEGLDCWTIALVNADAWGGGCETALAFDFRICSEDARFGFTQARFNLPPGWGGLVRLVELVGASRALQWLGRCERVGASEALGAGLVNEVVEFGALREALDEWVERLATQDRALIRALKGGVQRARRLPRDEAMAAERAPFARQWISAGHEEAMAEFLGGRDE